MFNILLKKYETQNFYFATTKGDVVFGVKINDIFVDICQPSINLIKSPQLYNVRKLTDFITVDKKYLTLREARVLGKQAINNYYASYINGFDPL